MNSLNNSGGATIYMEDLPKTKIITKASPFAHMTL
jgi:hypothetical protein